VSNANFKLSPVRMTEPPDQLANAAETVSTVSVCHG
jgi:hypothetical protein